MSLYQVDALRRVGERLRRSDRLRAEGCGPESAPPSPGGGARRGPAALAWGRRGPAPRALARCAFGFRAFRGMAALGAFGPLFTLSPAPRAGGPPFAAPPRRSRRRSPRCARSASGPLWGRGGWLRPSPPAFAGPPPLAGPPLAAPSPSPGRPAPVRRPLRGWGRLSLLRAALLRRGGVPAAPPCRGGCGGGGSRCALPFPAFAAPAPPLSPAVLCRCCAPPDKSPGAQKKGQEPPGPYPET